VVRLAKLIIAVQRSGFVVRRHGLKVLIEDCDFRAKGEAYIIAVDAVDHDRMRVGIPRHSQNRRDEPASGLFDHKSKLVLPKVPVDAFDERRDLIIV
jgi:hypothetical protein